MNRYSYARPSDLDGAIREIAAHPESRIVAGGTNIVDLMKYNVERPERLIDINRLPGLDTIAATPSGGLRIGALVSNADVANDDRVRLQYPMLSSAILHGASPQLRNAATTGGNLLQRTRCYYFYDPATPCNKREPGSGCPAVEGLNRIHAILGASASCVATHPSDMCVALAALGASVHVAGPRGARDIAFAEFHRLPGDTPDIETNLARDEIVLWVQLPPIGFAANYTYLKLRDRLSYAFALISVAVGLEMDGGVIETARIALGGVAHKPWRVPEAEALLQGKVPGGDVFDMAADKLLEGAQGLAHNGFKIELARRTIVRALSQAASGTPQSVTDKRIA
jgi:xanthine dehydrogenase YagS FAD-binding subunit